MLKLFSVQNFQRHEGSRGDPQHPKLQPSTRYHLFLPPPPYWRTSCSRNIRSMNRAGGTFYSFSTPSNLNQRVFGSGLKGTRNIRSINRAGGINFCSPRCGGGGGTAVTSSSIIRSAAIAANSAASVTSRAPGAAAASPSKPPPLQYLGDSAETAEIIAIHLERRSWLQRSGPQRPEQFRPQPQSPLRALSSASQAAI